ncbi:MAG: mycofactocin precursor [Actinobacteria bacterium]|nr:mycofactocin precursor [Actinomycetota bacterium]MBI3257097.1 mycofactocin precursor [Actinomycetota bacterium]
MAPSDTATAEETVTSTHSDEIVDDMLIEEISIDGMCGVY